MKKHKDRLAGARQFVVHGEAVHLYEQAVGICELLGGDSTLQGRHGYKEGSEDQHGQQ